MKKIAINRCFGGFDLSISAIKRLGELKGHDVHFYETRDFETYKHVKDSVADLFHYPTKQYLGEITHNIPNEMFISTLFDDNESREDPDLIKVIEELGDEASGRYGEVKIVEIPKDVEYTIEEYDGVEWIAEKHRTWQ